MGGKIRLHSHSLRGFEPGQVNGIELKSCDLRVIFCCYYAAPATAVEGLQPK